MIYVKQFFREKKSLYSSFAQIVQSGYSTMEKTVFAFIKNILCNKIEFQISDISASFSVRLGVLAGKQTLSIVTTNLGDLNITLTKNLSCFNSPKTHVSKCSC